MEEAYRETDALFELADETREPFFVGYRPLWACMRAMLEAAGMRVHVYTSPHLVHFAERIRLASALIDDVELRRSIAEGSFGRREETP